MLPSWYPWMWLVKTLVQWLSQDHPPLVQQLQNKQERTSVRKTCNSLDQKMARTGTRWGKIVAGWFSTLACLCLVAGLGYGCFLVVCFISVLGVS